MCSLPTCCGSDTVYEQVMRGRGHSSKHIFFARGVSVQPTPKKWRGAPPLPAPDKRPSQLGVTCRQVCCMTCVQNNNKPVREEHGCCCKWRETRLETTPAHFKLATTVSVSLPPFVRQPCGRLVDSIQFGCPAAWQNEMDVGI